MKLILTVFAVSVLFAGVLAMAGAADVLELSTLNKKANLPTIVLPQLSATMPTIPPAALGGKVNKEVVNLSTLGRKAQTSSANATLIKGSNPITFTPMFAIKNANVINKAGTVFTLPQAISANPRVYTPPIAIFGGA